MAEEVLELIARIRPDGAEETADSLEDVRNEFNETASTVETESNRLEQFSERFKGALTVAVTGLGIAVGAIASRIPVLGESATALDAILDSIALKFDEVLRPALGETNDELFGLSGTIDDTDASFVALAATFGGIGGAGLLGVLAKVLFTLGLLGSAVAGIAIAVAGAAITLGLFVSELAGVSDFTSATQQEFTGLKGVLQDFLTVALAPVIFSLGIIQGFLEGRIPGAIEGAKSAISALVASFVGLLAAGLSVAGAFGTVVLANFDRFFSDFVRFARQAFNTFLELAEDTINQVVEQFNTVSEAFGGPTLDSVSFNRLSITDRETSNRRARNRAARRRERLRSGTDRLQNVSTTEELLDVLKDIRDGESQTTIQIDGRTVAKSSEPFLGSGTATRGR